MVYAMEYYYGVHCTAVQQMDGQLAVFLWQVCIVRYVTVPYSLAVLREYLVVVPIK